MWEAVVIATIIAIVFAVERGGRWWRKHEGNGRVANLKEIDMDKPNRDRDKNTGGGQQQSGGGQQGGGRPDQSKQPAPGGGPQKPQGGQPGSPKPGGGSGSPGGPNR